jgi:hypothetical protein
VYICYNNAIETKEVKKMKKYNFSTSEYILSHGKSPRGIGHWAFEIEGCSLPEIAPEACVDRRSTIFWVPGVWTLSEAKRRAEVMLEANAVPFGTTVSVAP